ncbi:MAG: helix-turn-helix domain-containing protein [bacterium]|nr:helix-turn-helix domain-containing protein [bacterium]
MADRVVEAAAPAHLQLLTTDELAAQLGVTAVTVRIRRTQREMGPPWVMIGRLIRYRATAVEQGLNGQ